MLNVQILVSMSLTLLDETSITVRPGDIITVTDEQAAWMIEKRCAVAIPEPVPAWTEEAPSGASTDVSTAKPPRRSVRNKTGDENGSAAVPAADTEQG